VNPRANRRRKARARRRLWRWRDKRFALALERIGVRIRRDMDRSVMRDLMSGVYRSEFDRCAMPLPPPPLAFTMERLIETLEEVGYEPTHPRPFVVYSQYKFDVSRFHRPLVIV